MLVFKYGTFSFKQDAGCWICSCLLKRTCSDNASEVLLSSLLDFEFASQTEIEKLLLYCMICILTGVVAHISYEILLFSLHISTSRWRYMYKFTIVKENIVYMNVEDE